MKIGEERGKYRERSRPGRGMAEAVAVKVRRDFPTHTVDQVAVRYGLTTGEAKGVVYGTASRTTLDKMLKRGGWALVVELGAVMLGQSLEQYIEEQAAAAAVECEAWRHREERLRKMEDQLRGGPPA